MNTATVRSIRHMIEALEPDADRAFSAGDVKEGERLDAMVSALVGENERRMEAAMAEFHKYDEDAQDSGRINAEDTEIDGTTFGQLGNRALHMCEFWEVAAASALSIIECR